MTNPHDIPAFPTSARGFSKEGGSKVDSKPGMSIWDAAALRALPAVISATSAGQHNPMMQPGEKGIAAAIVRDACDMADAFCAERAKRRGKK